VLLLACRCRGGRPHLPWYRQVSQRRVCFAASRNCMTPQHDAGTSTRRDKPIPPTTITSHSRQTVGRGSCRSYPDSDPGQSAPRIAPRRHASDDSGDSDRSSVRLPVAEGSEEAAHRPLKRRRRSRWDAGPGWTPRQAHQDSPEHHAPQPPAANQSSRSSSEGPAAASAVLPKPQQLACDAHAVTAAGGDATCALREAAAQTERSATQPADVGTAPVPQACSSPARMDGTAGSDPDDGESAGADTAEQRSTERAQPGTDSSGDKRQAGADSARDEAGRGADPQSAQKQHSSPVSGAPADPAAEAARCATLHLGLTTGSGVSAVQTDAASCSGSQYTQSRL